MRQANPTAGSKFLETVLTERGFKVDLSRHLKVRLELVGRWARGERKPSTPMRAQLQKLLKLDWELWDKPADALHLGAPEVAFARAALGELRSKEAKAEPSPTFPGGQRVA